MQRRFVYRAVHDGKGVSCGIVTVGGYCVNSLDWQDCISNFLN